MYIPNRIIYVMLIFVFVGAGSAYSAADNEIKYVDPGNKDNYIIFYPDIQKFEIHQDCGINREGDYWETAEGYHLTGNALFGGEIQKAGNEIILPDNTMWARA